MDRRIHFIKMHGLGNDFVVLDETVQGAAAGGAAVDLSPELAQRLCDRQKGIGADQILHLKPVETGAGKMARAVCRMEIWNADGSRSEMCGNGVRAAALLKRTGGDGHLAVETPVGVQAVRFVDGDLVEVNMGQPGAANDLEEIKVSGRTFRFWRVNMGNPHAVIFVQDFTSAEPGEWGPLLEAHSTFPDRTNVEFVRPNGVHELEIRVWERGAGLTLACGSGACAAAVAGILQGRAASPVKVRLPGGDLEIRWEGPGKDLYMTGPAEKVFEGDFEY